MAAHDLVALAGRVVAAGLVILTGGLTRAFVGNLVSLRLDRVDVTGFFLAGLAPVGLVVGECLLDSGVDIGWLVRVACGHDLEKPLVDGLLDTLGSGPLARGSRARSSLAARACHTPCPPVRSLCGNTGTTAGQL